MSAIIADDTERVIGIQAWFLFRLLDFCVGQSGPRAYLDSLRNRYEWGYNSWDLRELTVEQQAEFSGLIRAFVLEFEFTPELIGYRNSALEVAERIERRLASLQP